MAQGLSYSAAPTGKMLVTSVFTNWTKSFHAHLLFRIKKKVGPPNNVYVCSCVARFWNNCPIRKKFVVKIYATRGRHNLMLFQVYIISNNNVAECVTVRVSKTGKGKRFSLLHNRPDRPGDRSAAVPWAPGTKQPGRGVKCPPPI